MSSENVQSPIALEIRDAEFDDEAVPLEFVGHWDRIGGSAEMINTGTSAMIMLPNRNKKPYIVGGPLKDKYIFEQIHFHWVGLDFGSLDESSGKAFYGKGSESHHRLSFYSI